MRIIFGAGAGLLLLMVVAVTAAIPQRDVDLLAEFFVATKFGNATPVTVDNACIEWPALVTCGTNGIIFLTMTNQNLTGVLPSSLAGMSYLTELAVDQNFLTGTLPPEYGNLTKLQLLHVNNNQLDGPLPQTYQFMVELIEFRASSNHFVGTLPPLYARWTYVYLFDVSNNQLSGTLPDEYKNLTLELGFYVANNNFTGTLPAGYESWLDATRINFSGNKFTGSLPPEYGRMRSLRYLSVAGNGALTGPLPLEYANLTSLVTFMVDNNQFSGALPPSFGAWFLLTTFSVANNLLSGSLPSEYASWTSIVMVDVSGNSLSGSLPPSYSSWGNLKSLHASSNALTGTIPSQWGMAQLNSLVLHSNSFLGTLPSSTFPSLQALSVSYNYLSGTLPPANTWPFLQLLDVQHNPDLRGTLRLPFGTAISTICATSLCAGTSPTAAVVATCLPSGLIDALLSQATITKQLSIASRYEISLPLCPILVPPQVAATNATEPMLASQTATAASLTVMVYVTLAVGGGSAGRMAVPVLQRTSAVLSITARCRVFGSSNRSDASPMFEDLSDNPLGVSLPVGSPNELDFAAGAAVMNAVLVIGLGALLHAVHALQQRVFTQGTIHLLLVLLPSSLLPGSVAVFLGTLLQPSVSACVVLIAMRRSAASVACGIIMLCAWAALPAYYSWAVLWRGRTVVGHQRRFALCGVPATNLRVATRGRQPLRLTASERAKAVCVQALTFLTFPAQNWSPSSRRGHSANYAEFLMEHLEAVFGAYVDGREWYFLVEWGLSAAGGALIGAAEVKSREAAGNVCFTAAWVSWSAVALGAAEVTLCVLLRPQSVRLELWSSVATSTLASLASVLAATGVDDIANGLLTAVSVVEIVIMAVLMMGTLGLRCQSSRARQGKIGRVEHPVPPVLAVEGRVVERSDLTRSDLTSARVSDVSQFDQLKYLVHLACQRLTPSSPGVRPL